MKKEKILIAGGDLRQIYCAQRLSRDFEVCYTGFDDSAFKGISGVFPASEKCRFAVLPVPPPDESGKLFSPLYSGELTVSAVENLLTEDAVLFTGTAEKKTAAFFPSHEISAYMDREELAIKNAVPTAEAAVMLALERLPVTLNSLPVLIVGLGRIGMLLAQILKGFGSRITAAVRNEKGAAKAAAMGIESISTEDINGDYCLVFNTVPRLVLSGYMLEKFPKDTLFIDLASKPGGMDFKAADKLGIRYIHALGLPGKNAPVSAGYAEAETVIGMINERGNDYE